MTALVAWSTGKDSAWALHEVRRAGELEVVGLLTTVSAAYDRVSMHGVRTSILASQAAAAGLPLTTVAIPSPCSNEAYEAAMDRALDEAIARGVTAVVFGDLFLADVRAYRERMLARAGLRGVFPLWGRPTPALAREMLDAGLEAFVTCVDPRRLDRSFAGRRWDAALVASLPGDVDPCGENGELHTCVVAGPMLTHRVEVSPGEVVERDGFVFADLVPGGGRPPAA